MAGLLEAAACVIAGSGYEPATMSEIATRAGASIGSLYQFFPNKEAISQALCTTYALQIEELWAPIGAAKSLHLEAFVDRLIDVTVEFGNTHPAFLALLDAPVAARKPAAIRKRFRETMAGFLLTRKPRMSKQQALRIATVTLKLINGLMMLYREAKHKEKPHIVHEYKIVLRCYLSRRMA